MFSSSFTRWLVLCSVALLGCGSPGQDPAATIPTLLPPGDEEHVTSGGSEAERAPNQQLAVAAQTAPRSSRNKLPEHPPESARDDPAPGADSSAPVPAQQPPQEPDESTPAPGHSAGDDNSDPEASAPEPSVLIVAADGSGDHRTITAAMKAAGYLDEIRIQPGLYREALVIDRRVSLSRGDGQGPVVINGGDLPALTLDRVTMVEVSGLVLKGGGKSLATVEVKRGQLRLSSCRLDSSPHSAAAGTSREGAQLVLVDCIVRAGQGTALSMVEASNCALESCRFSWGPGNTTPFMDPAALAVVTMRTCTFGQMPIEGPFLVSQNLLNMLPQDGVPTLFVQPDRALWPHWATRHETHFESLAVAVDQAPPGSHIRVSPGTYRERLGIVRPLTISSTGASGAVKLIGDGQSALWINANSEVTLRGISLSSSVGQGTPAVQINGGVVTLIDCRIDNDAGHALIVTDHHAVSRVSLAGCRIFSMKKAVYATGDDTRVQLRDCLLAGASIALFLMNGATAEVTNSTFDTERYAVELWGPGASARLEGCTILRASQVLAFNEGAVRSQVQTAGLIVK